MAVHRYTAEESAIQCPWDVHFVTPRMCIKQSRRETPNRPYTKSELKVCLDCKNTDITIKSRMIKRDNDAKAKIEERIFYTVV